MLIKNSDQVPAGYTRGCDICDRASTATFVHGFAHIARGGTGRYCEVLWVCDECGDLDNAVDVQDARDWVNSQGDNSYCDF